MIDMCLEALVSGVINSNSPTKERNQYTGIIHITGQKPKYVIADRYAQVKLCTKKEKFSSDSKNSKQKLNMIKTID
jgi:hypothetical protein